MSASAEVQILKWLESFKFSNNFESWMGDLPNSLKLIPVNSLAIPGSHDSMSSGISGTSGISPDSSLIVKALGKILGPFVKPLVYKWCVTQSRTAEEQLQLGIRYFDLRIAVHKPTGIFQFVHGMYAEEITQPFNSIKNFLLSNQQEVVILDIQHFYKFGTQHHKLLQNLLHDHFGNMLCPLPECGDVSKISLSWMTSRKYQVILIYRGPIGGDDVRLWPSRLWPTPWPQTTSIQSMVSFLSHGLAKRSSHVGYVTQCVLTPTPSFVVRHPLSNLLDKCAAPCNYAIISWLNQQHPGQKGVNVVITDFFDFDPVKFPFVKTIVLLNYKLIQEESVQQSWGTTRNKQMHQLQIAPGPLGAVPQVSHSPEVQVELKNLVHP
ncbi:PI-PLC X domain-containing protein 3 [Frankliniella fusca]|uniref:PI-PLC X domain-containing protein 3 n=1 Tax=Frankliniella fusca TaxID=407009 RepID=A0AAE1LI29_9NEOP|nr:PI-PLC X domain-containing protein 3 [Frankliniella fusca]